MTEHTGLPVHGYTSQSDAKIGNVNLNKQIEERVLRRIDDLKGMSPDFIDGRWLAVARTHIQEGFMAMNRAIFQPERVVLPEDIQKGGLAMQGLDKQLHEGQQQYQGEREAVRAVTGIGEMKDKPSES